MKKLKYLLFVLFLIPGMVKADMGAPDVRPYDMVVTNPDGIDYYETEVSTTPSGHLNKDEKFTVTYEYSGNYSITISGKNGSYVIKSSEGTALVQDKLDPKTASDDHIKKYSTPQEAIIYGNDGVDMLKGPASTYDKVGHLNKGIKVTYKYSDTDLTHIYVEHNGKEGWVNILDSKVLIRERQDFITKKDYKILGTTIPKNTVVKSEYKSDAWSSKVLVEYNGVKDLVETRGNFDLVAVYKEDVKSKTELKVYESANKEGNEVITIPSGSEFLLIASSYEELGSDEGNLYVEYEGKRGWVKVYNYDDYEVDEDKEIDNPNILEEVEEPKKEEPKKEEPKKEEKKNKKKQSAEDYTLTYVIVGISVAIIAIGAIIILNKKSKKKKVEETVIVKEEKVEETKKEDEVEKVCPNCGTKVDGSFCPECGTKIEG